MLVVVVDAAVGEEGWLDRWFRLLHAAMGVFLSERLFGRFSSTECRNSQWHAIHSL